MAQEQQGRDAPEKHPETERLAKAVSRHIGLSKKITDHLANERTFLAWVRTSISVMAFGFVVERFGLLLRELGLKVPDRPIINTHYSTIFGTALTILGVLLMVVALTNFLHYRRAIDAEVFHPRSRYAVVLTVIIGLIGAVLAVYLYFTT